MIRFIPSNSQNLRDKTWIDRMMELIQKSFDSLLRAVTNDIIVTATIGTGDTVVRHGLGAPPTSWEVVDINANAVVWRSATVNATPAQTIILKASAPVIVKLRFT